MKAFHRAGLACALTTAIMAPMTADAQDRYFIRRHLVSTAQSGPNQNRQVCTTLGTDQASTGSKALARTNTTGPGTELTDAVIRQRSLEYCSGIVGVQNCMVTVYDYRNGTIMYVAQAGSGGTIIPKAPTSVASNPPSDTRVMAGTCG